MAVRLMASAGGGRHGGSRRRSTAWFFEWVMHQLQVPLGEVEIFSGCLQIAESEWCADQFQLQADGWPSCGACAFLGCKQVSEREFNLCGCSQPRESQIGI
jgi:hypothetical protein